MNKACLKIIADQLAAETMARAAIIRAQHKLRGRRLSYVDSLNAALDVAMKIKPERHHFVIDAPGGAPALARHMSMTGG